ncbi:MAG: ATP-binding protein [Prevotella sp.]|nr:ATP-binding protein [Prevotella sp.]MBQ9570740.1 ATP-binding protein [Prevotella sp.]MBR0523877.1 ATP-binding protein [Prevotella sp.]
MKGNTEGRRMWISVMLIFIAYAATFILFDDIDRKNKMPLNEPNDWHLLFFSIIVMIGLGWLLYGYARRMDERISREQRLRQDKMRRELTQNIAHELKTPVASILGYTDTILDSADISEETKLQFIKRANAQAKRLSALLQDLSTLNKMEYASHLLQKERVDISDLVADTILESEPALSARQMTVINCLPEDIPVEGNWQLLYSIFRNLIDNAINYAGRNTTIKISAEQLSDRWHFTFSDNGAGVPKEHLSRIFERFYRVDKGRSREMGGTGLGLSIVKNAVLLHGGQITVKNGNDGGLCFDFTLRK